MTTQRLGILGGMGPLASLAFLRTIYEGNPAVSVEQAHPDILLHSLSSTPDRTAALLGNGDAQLAEILTESLRRLTTAGASRIVLCCFTSHALIHHLPAEIARKIISLVDLTLRELIDMSEPALLLASRGSYERSVFRLTNDTLMAEKYLVIPDDDDKRAIHNLIYDHLKGGKDVAPVYAAVKKMLRKYQVGAFIAGCTEFHLLTRYIRAEHISGITFIDPLHLIPRRLHQLMAAPGAVFCKNGLRQGEEIRGAYLLKCEPEGPEPRGVF